MAKLHTNSMVGFDQLSGPYPTIYSLHGDRGAVHLNLTVDFIAHIDERYVSEKELLGATVRDILLTHGTITNKHIILSLIQQLEKCSDVVRGDILRNALEIVVGITPDDLGF